MNSHHEDGPDHQRRRLRPLNEGEPSSNIPNMSQTPREAPGRTNRMNRAAVKVAGLNIRGYGSTAIWSPNNKWKQVARLIRAKKISVLVVSEAHMDVERHNEIEKMYGNRMRVLYTRSRRSRNEQGVAIVLNKDILDTSDTNIECHEIIAGRAMLIDLGWHREERTCILGVYAPNLDGDRPNENAEMWENIGEWLEAHPQIPTPKVIVGDENFVEERIDRLPIPEANDSANTREAFDDLARGRLHLVDGWRTAYPETRAYTHLHKPNNSQARLDRIYIHQNLVEHCFEWEIAETGLSDVTY